jgi:phage tail-like protein
MATGERKDPYRQFRFRVEIDGITQAGFHEVTFPDTTTDPVDYREGTDLPVFRKLSGLTKFGNITLKWGITDSTDLYKWRKQVIETGAEGARKNVSIILIDEAGADKARWNITNACQAIHRGFQRKGTGGNELLELVHDDSSGKLGEIPVFQTEFPVSETGLHR